MPFLTELVAPWLKWTDGQTLPVSVVSAAVEGRAGHCGNGEEKTLPQAGVGASGSRFPEPVVKDE